MSEEAKLVERALTGDGPGLRALVDRLTPVIQRRVARVLARTGGARGRAVRQELQDLVQEVFVALLENGARVLRMWEPARGMSLDGFVGLVAEREAISILRSGRRSPWSEDPTSYDSLDGHVGQELGFALNPERIVSERDLLGQILDTLYQELSPKGLLMFELLLVEQLEVDEVARRTGLDAGAIYAWRSRIGKMAREARERLAPRGEVATEGGIR